MVRKRIKKAISKVKKAVSKRKTGDRLPDLPGPDFPLYAGLPIAGPYGGLVGYASGNPWVQGALLGYTAAENTERFWGPPVERQAQWTAKQWEEYQDWYERNVRLRYAGSEIDPDSPLGYIPPSRRGMMMPEMEEETPQRKKRAVSKANKATKMAYGMLSKRVKGKMTKKRCQELLKKCAKMASKANPNTKSRIGKGNTRMCKDCRKIRKSVWNTTKMSC